jgi:hypothetical protein
MVLKVKSITSMQKREVAPAQGSNFEVPVNTWENMVKFLVQNG